MLPRAVWIDHGKSRGELVAPYNKDFLEELKASIHPTHREWNADLKVWTFMAYAKAAVLELAGDYFNVLDTATIKAARRAKTTTSIGWPWTVLSLTPGAPSPVIDAAYRALSKQAHPDAGGSHEQMVALNAAYEACKAGR